MAPSIRFVGLLIAALILGMGFQTFFFEKSPGHAMPTHDGAASANLEKLIADVGVSLKTLRERSVANVAPVVQEAAPINVSVNLDGAEELAAQLKGFSAALDKAIISVSHKPNRALSGSRRKSTTSTPAFRKREIAIVRNRKCLDTNVAYANNTIKSYECNAGSLLHVSSFNLQGLVKASGRQGMGISSMGRASASRAPRPG